MTNIKALDKLRKLKGEVVDYRWGVDFDRAVDDLEAEIAEWFMELPVDVDGVPIHIGDALRARYGKGKTKLTDEQIAEGLEHYRSNAKADIVVIDELRGDAE